MAKRKKAARKRSRRRPPAPPPAFAFSSDGSAEDYAWLGDLATTVGDAEVAYRAGIAAGDLELGADWIEQHAGRLGEFPEACAYLNCRRGLAQCLGAAGRLAEALAECEELARLDAADTTTARFVHLAILMELRKFAAARALWARYRDPNSAGWAYSRALLEFADAGDSAESRRLLTAAIAVDPDVPGLLLSEKELDHERALTVSDDEALLDLRDARVLWIDVPGAISWLRSSVNAGHVKPRKPSSAPRQGSLDVLTSLPQSEGEEWQMHLARERGAGWSLHVVSRDGGRMIAVEVTTTKPRAEDMWGVISNAMRFPHEGDPRRPATIAMRPGVFPAAWGKRFARVGIRQELRDALPEIDRSLADVDKRIATAERARADEAHESFDPAAVAADLAGLPQEQGEIWEADLRRAPAWVTGEGEPYRPWIALVASRTRDRVLVPDVITTRPGDGYLMRLVLRAIREAGIRPEAVEVLDADEARTLATALELAGVPVVVAADGLPVIEQMAESLATAIAGPDTLRPLATVPGMTDALQRGLYAAAADFYLARPWRKLPSDTPLDIHGPDGRLVHAVVMGQSGVQQGLAIYEDRKTLAAALRGDEKAAARSTSLAVMFGEAFEISARDHDAIERKGFDLAGPEAWPLVIRIDPGFATRPPLAWEVVLITACLRDVVSRVAAGPLTPETPSSPRRRGG